MNVERYVRLIAGIVVLVTVAAGYWLSPWFFLLTAFMGANLVQSGFTNWCPMMPVLRSFGVKDAPA
jgi:predicted CDP-diglyceride synthetase/phosphatidate cytidylyltransferase